VLPPEDKAALVEAVRAIEASSRAEVVVALRPRSARYDRGPLLLGGVAALLVSGFLLFSPWEFTLLTIGIAPWIAGGMVAVAAVWTPALERLLAPRPRRRAAVEQAARATFVERGVSLTRERTGVLVYVSHAEREAVVVADKGVTDLVAPDVWAAAVARVEASGRAGGDARQVALALVSLGEVLTRDLPARADDVDELPNLAEAS